MESHRNTSLIQATMFNRNESRGEGSLLVRKWMLNWWLNRSWIDRHKAGTNSVLQNRPRWQILTGKWWLASLVTAGLAKSVTNGAFCGAKSRLPAFKSHRNNLNRVVPFHCAILVEESRRRGGEILLEFFEEERAREEPWVKTSRKSKTVGMLAYDATSENWNKYHWSRYQKHESRDG
jgi:hypothetical protein